MIEILVLYIAIGAVCGLLNWIVDMFLPTQNAIRECHLKKLAILLIRLPIYQKGRKLNEQ